MGGLRPPPLLGEQGEDLGLIDPAAWLTVSNGLLQIAADAGAAVIPLLRWLMKEKGVDPNL